MLTVVQVGPRIKLLEQNLLWVQTGERVNHMGAEPLVQVLWYELAFGFSIKGPIRYVAHNLERTLSLNFRVTPGRSMNVVPFSFRRSSASRSSAPPRPSGRWGCKLFVPDGTSPRQCTRTVRCWGRTSCANRTRGGTTSRCGKCSSWRSSSDRCRGRRIRKYPAV